MAAAKAASATQKRAAGARLRTVRVTVRLKPGVLDAQGQAIKKGLDALGYGGVAALRAGRYYEIDMPDAPDLEARVRAMCEGLLANTLIEEFRYDVD
ncbi:MAG TPA: phosphoribosylformylglycinamidine synthase subunit PurS [bacterium]|nr:phosphoribosylformylglycinamidine synthase subunit PurS [bacterium]